MPKFVGYIKQWVLEESVVEIEAGSVEEAVGMWPNVDYGYRHSEVVLGAANPTLVMVADADGNVVHRADDGRGRG